MSEVVREWSEVIKTGGLVAILVVVSCVCIYLERERNRLLTVIAGLQETRVKDAVDTARQAGEQNAKSTAVLGAIHELLQRRRAS